MPDQDHAAHEASNAGQTRQIDRVLVGPYPAEMIEHHQDEHLTHDEEHDECRSFELRHEGDGEVD